MTIEYEGIRSQIEKVREHEKRFLEICASIRFMDTNFAHEAWREFSNSLRDLEKLIPKKQSSLMWIDSGIMKNIRDSMPPGEDLFDNPEYCKERLRVIDEFYNGPKL
ncbi:MAG: hypothetical protein EOP04_08435 [Proteobacteria bacterium]|nr:MAG: hypothetical protein EOP04_08435 [Pseudomonadota bacterium]